jgi:3-phosphoshikimate 1-carboxyvinyltransferase
VSTLVVRSGAPLVGKASVPGDKSISHRALMLAAIAEGKSRVQGFLPAGDCLATVRCLEELGVQIEREEQTTLTVHGRGLRGLKPSPMPLNCDRSGTTMRLLSGILAGQPFLSVLDGDAQLRKRPMGRITEPLRLMGATVEDEQGKAPITIEGGDLVGISYRMPMASGQVKSAILMAGLFADGPTSVEEPGPSRDHTERMLKAMGANLRTDGKTITLHPGALLISRDVHIPGDVSSAAFLVAAATMLPTSKLHLSQVGVNPTRMGLLETLRSMGAQVNESSQRMVSGEPVADLTVEHSELQARDFDGALIVRMIDEIPLLALVASQAQGTTRVSDAGELRHKETDRISATVTELRKLGVHIEELPDGFIVRGPTTLWGADVDCQGDHRLAMTLTIGGLLALGTTSVRGSERIGDSYPGFVETLCALGAEVHEQD